MLYFDAIVPVFCLWAAGFENVRNLVSSTFVSRGFDFVKHVSVFIEGPKIKLMFFAYR